MATMRRASHQLPGLDPRSPMTLTIPQHQILTSFQSLPSPFHQNPSPFQAQAATSPFSHSPSPFTFRAPIRVPTNTPISPISRTAQLLYDIAPSPARTRDRSSSLKFLLQTGRVPSVISSCPCGQGRQTTKHILKSCPHFENEREQLLSSRSPRSPGMKSPRSLGRTREQKVVNAARKWRMRTLLGRYRRAVQMQKQEGFGNPMIAAGKRTQKSPRPDVVELGLVGNGFKEKLERGARHFI
jgi:hypothetical protein